MLDAAQLRVIAVRAGCDPRTVRKVAQGLEVRGMAGRRARAALCEAGIAVPEMVDSGPRLQLLPSPPGRDHPRGEP